MKAKITWQQNLMCFKAYSSHSNVPGIAIKDSVYSTVLKGLFNHSGIKKGMKTQILSQSQ